MDQAPRVALFFCSDAEAEAVVRRLGDWPVEVVGDGLAPREPFDIAILGAFAASRRAVVHALDERLTVPAILLLTSPDDDEPLAGRFASISLQEFRRLPHVINREVKLHRAEHALRESERRYRDLIDQAQEGVWVIDATGKTTFANHRLAEMLGCEVESLIGESLFDFIDADMRVLAVRDFHRGGDFRFIRRDGRPFWGMLSASPLFDTTGRYQGTLALISDITARKDVAAELSKSEARYRALIEQATDIIFSIDAEGRLISLNPAFARLTGWSIDAWIGRHFAEVIAPASVEMANARFALLLGGASNDFAEYELRKADGGTFTAEITTQSLVVNGIATGTVGIARDVTSRKAAEAERDREKRLASLGQLAASVAHEFNNVLMSILPFAELLKRRLPDDERVATATKHIFHAVRRGRQVSQEILRFSRPTSPSFEAIDVREWLDDFSDEARTMLGPKYRVTLHVPQEPMFAISDKPLLHQVATNLVINARDAMPEGGEVSLEVQRRAGNVEILVSDAGSGIAPELVERVFDPLFTTKSAGNGLGLTIAHQAMSVQGGTLLVNSTLGVGSTFTMRLRACDPPPPPPAQVATPASIGRRVVIVEDEESIADGLAQLLTDEKFDVHVVRTGGEASIAVEHFNPDLVLLDVNLPDASGIDVYELLHERWPQLPVVFSTGHADVRALEDVRKRHVPSIMKPYDAGELLAVIAGV